MSLFLEMQKALEMQKKTCAVYGQGAVDSICHKWVIKLDLNSFNLTDVKHPGLLTNAEGDKI